MMSVLQKPSREMPRSWAAQQASATERTSKKAAATAKGGRAHHGHAGSASGATASQSSSRAFSPPLRTAERALQRVNSSSASGFGVESVTSAAAVDLPAAASSRGAAGWQASLCARARQAPVASQLRSRISTTTAPLARKADPRHRHASMQGGGGTAGARNRTGINSSLDVGLAPTPPKESRSLHARELQETFASSLGAQRLASDLQQAHDVLELHAHQAQDACQERLKGLQRSEDVLEAFFKMLQSLDEEHPRALARTQILERLSKEASKGDSSPAPELAAEVVSGPDDAGGRDARRPVPAAEPGRGDDVEHQEVQETDGEAAGRHREFSLGQLQPADQEEDEQPNPQQQDEQQLRPSKEDASNECEHFWEFVVQGQLPPDETCDSARKTATCFPSNAMERVAACKIACVCVRGHRLDASVPNQDDFLLAMCSWGVQGRVALYGVFDGHGTAGHRCAAMARGFLPERIFGDPGLLSSPEEVLRTAFREAQEEMLRREPQETLNSGTTATVALVLEEGLSEQSGHENDESELSSTLLPGTFVYTAHVGDSRAILATSGDDDGGSGSTGTFTVTALTQDHRPDVESEAERVRRAGGEVRPHGTAGKQARVICPQTGHPGFALTRSLGLASGLECGIISEPEVSSHHVRPDAEALLVLGTDGLFEFCSGTAVAGHLFAHGVTEASLEEVVQESRKLWSVNSSNSTVDDATAMAVSLGLDLQARR